MNPFIYSDDNKRYHTLYYHNCRVFGGRVFKAAIDAGFTCPNIDGSKGSGGCIFCAGGSGYFTAGELSVKEQFRREELRIRAKYPNAKIIAYLQAHSNTYAPPAELERVYNELIDAGAAGLAIATRADCIDMDKARLLSSLPVPVTVELGLQTVHSSTAEKINRCHSFEEFLAGYDMLKSRGIRVCVHIINGLPGEDEEMMLDTARRLGKLRPDGVKIHLLHVIRGTPLCGIYESGGYVPLTKEQYIDIVIRQLELIPAATVIERLTGDGNKSTLAAPLWSADKIAVLGGIDKRQSELDTWQGKSVG
ncbi:MAG: TIGR01212 family radical SAM protein [Oscillospiraceae bacterium]|nr:TIGR01212 family radical SAM protein [Oscillospiraceae bacterium]